MQRLTGLVTEVTEREVAAWPRDTPIRLHPRLQALTLEIILRAVFGLDPGPRLDRLRGLLTEIIDMGATPIALIPALQRDLGPGSPGRQFARVKDAIDDELRELIDERRAAAEERDDVLAMLLEATHEDGSPMSFDEIRDELMTALVAGHETTASQLAWAFERLGREPGVVRELQREIDAGDGDAYLTATIQETMRRRPVLPNAEPRLTMGEYEVGGWTYPKGVVLAANAYLVHHDPAIYPDPYAFRPERFLDQAPGTYTWIPFGGGRRRCLGASFALLEMKVVLRAVLAESDVRAPHGRGPELVRRRSITISPRGGARVVLERRSPEVVGGAAAPAASSSGV
jgi:cytochrome P450